MGVSTNIGEGARDARRASGANRGARHVLCALAFAGLLTTGCQAYDATPLEALTNPDGPACPGRLPPARPTTEDGDDGNEYVIILRDVLLDQGGEPDDPPESEPWRSIGFNQDGICSDEPDNIQCEPIAFGAASPLDGDDGIDNTFGASFYPLLQLAEIRLDLEAGGIDDDLVAANSEGRGNVAFIIRGWNGEPDDPSIEVVVTQTVFGTPGDGSALPNIDVVGSEGFVAGTSTPVPLPNWDGNDYFWMRDDTFVADRPLVRVMNGYVSGGIITASVPDRTPLLLLGNEVGVRVAMTGLTAEGNITDLYNGPSNGSQTVTIAGRWAFEDMLATAETVSICPGSALFDQLTTQLEGLVDVYVDPDNVLPGAPCDGLSLGVTFQGYQGNFGGTAASPPVPNPCEDE